MAEWLKASVLKCVDYCFSGVLPFPAVTRNPGILGLSRDMEQKALPVAVWVASFSEGRRTEARKRLRETLKSPAQFRQNQLFDIIHS